MFTNQLVDTDANGKSVYGESPFKAVKDLILTGDQATVNPPIFTITGSVLVGRLWGVVTTDIGVNHTAASFRINDQTAQVYLTAIGGTTLSAIKAGSLIVKKDLVAVSEPTTLETMLFSPFIITKKTAAVTQIEYKYSTTDHPTTGAIRFYISYYPLSDDGLIQAA